MRITEVFHSIQGESSYAGQPCVFVRLTGCPLRCTWCDTDYAFYGGHDSSIDEILAKVQPYFHAWKPTDMLIWDNWRMLHCVSGHDPQQPRRMQRTTIKGDYGLGYFENNGKGDRILEMTV